MVLIIGRVPDMHSDLSLPSIGTIPINWRSVNHRKRGSGTPLVISTLNSPGILQQSQRGWYMTKWSLWVVKTRKESIIGKHKLRSMNVVLTFVPWVNTVWELAKSIDADIVSGLLSLQRFTHLTIQKKYFQKVSKRCSRRKIVFTYVWELWVATLKWSYLCLKLSDCLRLSNSASKSEWGLFIV